MSHAPALPSSSAHPVATVGALAVGPSGRALFIRSHKWSNLWGVPGGKIAYGEPFKTALCREYLEETGLNLHDIRVGPLQEAVDSPEFFRPAHFILLNFIARAHNETVRLNNEAQAYAWLEPERALAYPLNSPTRTLVAYYLKHRHTTEAV
jgi:ADP-ribose pyrophosphatase YjhB (NUDIX family)